MAAAGLLMMIPLSIRHRRSFTNCCQHRRLACSMLAVLHRPARRDGVQSDLVFIGPLLQRLGSEFRAMVDDNPHRQSGMLPEFSNTRIVDHSSQYVFGVVNAESGNWHQSCLSLNISKREWPCTICHANR